MATESTASAEEESKSSQQKALEESLDKEIRSIIEADERQTSFNFAGLISSVFYLAIFISIGLPIWYKTTTPERWPLPDVSWLMVRSQTLTHYYKVSVVFLDPAELATDSPLMLDTGRLKNWLQNNHPRRQSFDGSLSFVNDWTVRNAFAKELNAYEATAKSSSKGPSLLEALDEQFAVEEVQALNSIVFYVLPRSVKTDSFISRGQYRALFIDLNNLPKPDEDEGENVHTVLANAINRQVESAQAIVEKFYSYQPGDNDQDIMLLLARNFDFIFDVIYEDEETVAGARQGQSYLAARKERHQKLLANIDQLIDAFYTHRFGFSNYFKINFISQVLHYVLPNDFVPSKLVRPNGGNNSSPTSGDRLLPLSTAHSMLDHIESRRVEHDNEKSYHLVLYVASSAKGALKFYDAASQAKSNLITTPFRGSILILDERQVTKDLFVGFRQLIRSFFRLDELPNSSAEQFFTQMEIESIVHALVQKHILKTLSSLESTEKLLKKVSNMVIEKKIAERMHKSMDDSMRAAELLSENGDVRKAYELSWNAYSLAEKAFFDPSLLSLLYFPDDQKYAIYLPLFLPICLPIITNSRIFYRFWQYLGLKKAKQE